MVKQKNKNESFMGGVVVLMFSQVLIKLLGLVYTLYLTNRKGFGDEGNAIYSSGFQIYTLLLTLSSIGIPNAIAKLISEHMVLGDYKGANRIFKVAFAVFACIGLCGTFILYFGAEYMSEVLLQIPEAKYTIKALSPSIFFVTIISVLRGFFNGNKQLKVTANSQTLEQFFKTVLTIILVELVVINVGLNTVAMAAVANLATTLATVLSFLYLVKFYKTTKSFTENGKFTKKYRQERIKNIIKQILSVSIPMTLSSLMTSINKNIDAVTVVRGLKNFMTEQDAKIQYGILSAKAGTLVNVPLSFNIAFATALVPALASAKASGELNTQGAKRVSLSLLVTILIGLPCTVGIFMYSEQILKLLYPNACDGKFILQASACTIIFTVLVQTVNGALQGIGKVMVPAISLGIGVIAKLLVNLILVPIPQIGAIGAEIGSIICYAISFIIGFCVLTMNMKLNLSFSKFVIKPMIATFFMAIISIFVYRNIINVVTDAVATLIAIFIAILIYIISVIGLKIFDEEELFMVPYGQQLYEFLKKLKLVKT